MTDEQFKQWRILSMACDMPRTEKDAKTLAAARQAFPVMFAALEFERQQVKSLQESLRRILDERAHP